MSILTGTAFITGDDQIIYNTIMNGMTKIINLDEDGILMEHDSIIMGTCLLPPVQAKIAEADGNEQLYDTIYVNHLLEPYQQQFISALISFLYKGGNLIFFLPELGYTNTMEKFIALMYSKYGIHIGLIGSQNPSVANCYYDDRCIPIWLNMIYSVRVIDAYEYLLKYPLDAPLRGNTRILELLIKDINPFEKTINNKIAYIERLHKLIHENPKVRPAITSIKGRDF